MFLSWVSSKTSLSGLYVSITKRFLHQWIKPEGHDTGIKIFNCITKSKEPLIVKNKNLVTWYTCGPTVYDSSHVGHASCFSKLNIIQRILKHYFGLNLVTVMNVTDVDDKIIARSHATKVPISEITRKFEKEFWEDLTALGIERPNVTLRVTEKMEIIKKFIEKLVKEGRAYQSDDNTVYFDVKAHDGYGKLQKISIDLQESVKHKKSNMDFALWKAAKLNEVRWESPWGDGRPGWHIECSALASHAFGSSIDIHAGGIDLRFPHHENEEAQSCAFHRKTQWVNYWVHTGHLHLKNCEKMSKSLKNTVSVATMLENTTPQVFRMACVMSHYRKNMEFSPEFLATAQSTLQNYINFIDVGKNYIDGLIKADIDTNVINQLITDSSDKIHVALTDDFNTPLVVKTLNEIVSTINGILHSSKTITADFKPVPIVGVLNLVIRVLDIFGLTVEKKEFCERDTKFTHVMNILSNFRQDVRQLGIANKDCQLLALCDTVRTELKSCDIVVKDHGKLSSWS